MVKKKDTAYPFDDPLAIPISVGEEIPIPTITLLKNRKNDIFSISEVSKLPAGISRLSERDQAWFIQRLEELFGSILEHAPPKSICVDITGEKGKPVLKIIDDHDSITFVIHAKVLQKLHTLFISIIQHYAVAFIKGIRQEKLFQEEAHRYALKAHYDYFREPVHYEQLVAFLLMFEYRHFNIRANKEYLKKLKTIMDKENDGRFVTRVAVKTKTKIMEPGKADRKEARIETPPDKSKPSAVVRDDEDDEQPEGGDLFDEIVGATTVGLTAETIDDDLDLIGRIQRGDIPVPEQEDEPPAPKDIPKQPASERKAKAPSGRAPKATKEKRPTASAAPAGEKRSKKQTDAARKPRRRTKRRPRGELRPAVTASSAARDEGVKAKEEVTAVQQPVSKVQDTPAEDDKPKRRGDIIILPTKRREPEKSKQDRKKRWEDDGYVFGLFAGVRPQQEDAAEEKIEIPLSELVKGKGAI